MNLLDRDARAVRADSGALDRMLSAAAGASGRPYIELLDDYSRQSDEWNGSAGEVLGRCGVQLSGVSENLKMLERCDREYEAHRKNLMRTLDAEPQDAGGNVLLDANADVVNVLADLVEGARGPLVASAHAWVNRPTARTSTLRIAYTPRAARTCFARWSVPAELTAANESAEHLVKHLNSAIRTARGTDAPLSHPRLCHLGGCANPTRKAA